jgi:hypothetical protein
MLYHEADMWIYSTFIGENIMKKLSLVHLAAIAASGAAFAESAVHGVNRDKLFPNGTTLSINNGMVVGGTKVEAFAKEANRHGKAATQVTSRVPA